MLFCSHVLSQLVISLKNCAFFPPLYFRVAARALLFESSSSPAQPAPVGRCREPPLPDYSPLASAWIRRDVVCLCCLFRDARAVYSCEAEHSHELSFPQGALFSNGEQG